MLAATYTQGGQLAFETLPEPSAGPGELLVAVRAAALCGTDLKIAAYGHRKLRDGQRIVLGHEFAGEVAALGAGVSGFTVGDRVGVAPNAGCGTCAMCLRGQSNYCAGYTAFGIDRDGAHAPFVRIPAAFLAQGNVVRLPTDLPFALAALLEPFSCVVSGVRNARLEAGDTVVVYGAGPMGRMVMLLCLASAAGRVFAVDPDARRLAQMRALGCEPVDPAAGAVPEQVAALTGGRGADVAITACPVAAVQAEAVGLLAPFGRLCLFGGLARGAGPVPLDTNAIHYRNLLVTGTTGGSVADYRTALALVANGRVDLSGVVSDRFGLSELAAAYDRARAGAAGKVLLEAP
jgi:L-iditol 2-dehydrogenase